LVQYLASYARVNDYGFIETPYRKMAKNAAGEVIVTEEIVYLDAAEEEKYVIAPASLHIDKDRRVVEKRTTVRKFGSPSIESAEKIDFVDVSSQQAFSITTNLIPGLANDDAARASRGANATSGCSYDPPKFTCSWNWS
jgi:DNA-directed RNA polymerase subunit beta